MHGGDICVSASRAGPARAWHPTCFTCQESRPNKFNCLLIDPGFVTRHDQYKNWYLFMNNQSLDVPNKTQGSISPPHMYFVKTVVTFYDKIAEI